jgi:hypothetical protein
MVAIADPYRAHWEAEDEYRKIGEREDFAKWLVWFLGTNSSAQAEEHQVDPRGRSRRVLGPLA